MRGVDHTNPKSWIGNVIVGNVKIEQEYKGGRDDANELLKQYLGPGAQINFDKMFDRKENPTIDHLQPGGDYIGCRPIDETENEDDMRTTALPAKDTNLENLRQELDANEHNDTDYVAEELNPSEETNNFHYLLIDGKKKSKLDLVAQMLCGFNGSRKVTSRPLRTQGFSKDEQLRRSRNRINSTSRAKNQEGKIKIGDPGVILVRVGKIVRLSVVEVVNFRQGSSSKFLDVIDLDDLDAEGGSAKATNVGIQILNLLPYKDLEPEAEDIEDEHSLTDFTWVWSKDYIQIKHPAKNDTSTSLSDTLLHKSLEGIFIQLLQVCMLHQDKMTWSGEFKILACSRY